MKRKFISILQFAGFVLGLVMAGGFLSCAPKASPNPDDVSAVSGGVIPRGSSIEVVFTREHDVSKPLPSDVIRLRPAVDGTASWKDPYTLVFSPSKLLKPGQKYSVTVGGKAGIKQFGFEFTAAYTGINVLLDPVWIDDNGDVIISGNVFIDENDDAFEPAKIEQIVKSSELGKPSWSHENGLHNFRFPPVARTEIIRTVEVSWSGDHIGSQDSGYTTVRIPSSGTFEMVGIRESGGIVEISFSSPVKQYSDLRGFVSLSGNTDVRYSLERNVIKIFGSRTTEGISPGTEVLIQDLEDIYGNTLIVPVQYTVSDRWELPEIRFPGTGTILPSSQGSAMALETRNVSGVLVEAFRIYGDNMVQFLQVNSFPGERELERVGEPVWTKAFDFGWKPQDQNRWVRRGLDVSELSRRYPDSMFRIRVSFRHRHVQYVCNAGHGDFSNLNFPDDTFSPYRNSSDESSYWDNYEESPDYDWYEWYRQRMDPCHPGYYMNMGGHNITIGRNILISDLGLIAKRSVDGRWAVAVTNLKTARPAMDTAIQVLNYQGRVLYQSRPGPDGLVFIPDMKTLSAPGEAAFIFAQAGFGRAWLRVNDSLALAVSHFDISGGRPVNGLRGLIYGERGVWRPGDDIYLTFLLADPEGTLPADHPVSFELEDPRGRVTIQRSYTSSVDGFFAIAASTAASAPTGDWTARVRVGGSVFSKNLKIETVMPNRLRMDLDFGPKPYIESAKIPVSLESEWLYGAPAPGLKADISVSFADRETTFPAYADYSFRDPSRTVSSERQTVWEGVLDNAGKAHFNLDLKPGSSVPGKLQARFMTRVFEPSGVFSSEQIAMDFSPYSRYVGVRLPKGDSARNMLLTDTDHQAEIVVLDAEGKAANGNLDIDCSLYKLSWRWWWEKGEGESAEYASTLSRSPVMNGKVNAVNGKAVWNFHVNYPEWGRYLVIARDSAGGHAGASIVYIDWPGWAGRSQDGGQGSSAMLALTPSKPVFNAVEKISVSFPSNKDAAALVSIEKGGRVIKNEWINCSDTATVYEFPAEPSMVPNVYVHVTLVQPHLQTANDLPIRLYGITPVFIEDPRTALKPRIESPQVWLPESRASFTVSEAEGRPMTYTVAVVDEGLLGLTRYNLPAPAAVFYAREASFLKSWDLYADVMGAYSGRLETLLAIGGGDDGIMDGDKGNQRFKPVVRFFGPYTLKAGESRQEAFDLPPYVGSLRIMVLAASSTTGSRQPMDSRRAYGTTEKSVQVSSDLMVFASVPRTLSPGDEAEIPVSVSSYKDGSRTVKVSLSVPGAEIIGVKEQDVAFDKTGEKTVRFTVKAPDLPGHLRFTANAASAGLRSASQITDLELRSTAIPVTKSNLGVISPGETWRGTIDYPGRPQSNTGIIELSRFPPLNLEKRLRFLMSYPHGCVEQTTSAVFPQLYLDRIMEMTESQRLEIRRNVIAGVERLVGFQTADGGLAYWPGGEDPNSWGTTYAGHFLLEARRAGFYVSEAFITKWLHFQKNRAALWQTRNGNPVDQAYRLYTIALAGQADLGSMNRLREQRGEALPASALWRLAAAYWYAGQRDIARSMIQNLEIPSNEFRELSGTFGSTLRDKAMILETLILSGDTARTRPLFEELSAALSSEDWLSTQETAYSLIAMTPYMSSSPSSAMQLDCTLAGRNANVNFTSPVTQLDMGELAGTSGAFSLANRSASPVYARVTVKGLPAEGAEPSLEEGLTLTAEYRDVNGRKIDPASLKLGDDMEVRVTVQNAYAQAVPETALVVILPASWEILNYRLSEESSSSGFKYQDIRDDRVMSYFDLGRGQSKTVSFRVNKTYAGNYFQPAIHAYAMYDESIRALIPGSRGNR
ncbi:MAG: alpha-2-macroglobulin [Treponema sp.]|jgi:uncharacterized protein YfaS (alpha-2-macroglobulin family)|nr:alpha-2-macroglobulin [Treponema sp.]